MKRRISKRETCMRKDSKKGIKKRNRQTKTYRYSCSLCCKKKKDKESSRVWGQGERKDKGLGEVGFGPDWWVYEL